MKTLGILGGMGPYASLRFCDILLQISTGKYGAAKNADFPHFLLSSLPVPDLIANRRDEERAVEMVEQEAKNLEAGGADLIVLTCNTMHLFEERYRQAINVPFLSLIQAVVRSVEKDGRKKVGLLGSMTTMQSQLYVAPLARAGVDTILPSASEKQELVRCIKRLVAKGENERDKKFLCSLIKSLSERGAKAVILGCTELPLVAPRKPLIPLYDSLEILAQTACEAIYKTKSWRASH